MRRNYAIVLAGGNGSRMGTDIPKQFLEIGGYPLLYYSLRAFQECDFIDGIILVSRREDMVCCRENIIDRYGFSKVEAVEAGGSQRFESVYNGLGAVKSDGYVFVHDGARPCIDSGLLTRLYGDVLEHGASVAAVPSKDTVKISDAGGFVSYTPDRRNTWIIQTPQVFDAAELKAAYGAMLKACGTEGVTDDAAVMERYGDRRVHLCEASYFNIKVTTPEDIILAENFLRGMKQTEKITWVRSEG